MTQSEFNVYNITYIVIIREIRVSVCLPITEYSILTNIILVVIFIFLFKIFIYSFSVESVLLSR